MSTVRHARRTFRAGDDALTIALADRIAETIVSLIDAALIYAASWHFLGWWGVALAFGVFGRVESLRRAVSDEEKAA